MKVLVVYYSMSGNAEYVANMIKDKIGADTLKIVPVKEIPKKGFVKYLWGGKKAIMKETPKLEDYSFRGEEYDTIILGTPVWASHIAPPLRTFIEDNKEQLKNKRIAGYACFMGSGGKEALNNIKELLEIDELACELLLIDPKDKASSEKDSSIEEFCNKIKGE